MDTYIAILRGINVSGHKMIKMKALQDMLTSLGFSHVRTYIQSGNVVFQSELKDTGKLGNMITENIRQVFGFEVPVLVLRHEEMAKVSGNNKFIAERKADISRLHVTFLSGEPEKGLFDKIGVNEYLPDEFYLEGKAVYLFCPGGYGNTKLNNTFFEKKLKVTATTRNWNTIVELVKMGGD